MRRTKGFVIAATGSGCGKTTISMGIMAWLTKNGYDVAPFKVGPDFIDPGHHTNITGRISRNIDGWMLTKDTNLSIYNSSSREADISIVEGVMGLYDGYDGKSDAGSTAQMAKWLDLPVILVVNAKSMARSAAALIKGFVEFDPEVKFAGVIFNNLGSNNHYTYLTEALQAYFPIPVIGGILRNDSLKMPERHLGLVTNDEHTLSENDTQLLVSTIDAGVDMDFIVKECLPQKKSVKDETRTKKDASIRIAIARDAAFCFYYQDNLDLLEQSGAELVFFSPISDETLPDNIYGLYLGGGYPEVFAKKLSENTSMRESIKKASCDNMPVYGECGGFMYLSRSFVEKNGSQFEMSGCFPHVTRLRDRFKSLGYREVTLNESTVLGEKGTKARGHEFHYSEIISTDLDVKKVYQVTGRNGKYQHEEGFVVNNTLGSYVHVHFKSNPIWVKNFIKNCHTYKSKQG